MRRRISRYTFVVCIFLCLSTAVLSADNPFAGTWKLNADRSRVSSGRVPTGRTTRIESEGKDLVLTLEGGGITTAQTQRLVFDGQEHPIESTRLVKLTGATSAVYKQLSGGEIETRYKKDGKVVATQKRTISENGRVLTSTMDGLSADSERFHEVFVYEKQ
jgi:hypothetical protein